MFNPPLIEDFPKEEAKYLIPVLRGELPKSRRLAINAALNLLSYCTHVFVKDAGGDDVVAMENATPLTAAACADLLEDTCRRRGGRVSAHAAGLPLASIVKLLGPLVLEWLAGRFIKA